MFEEPMRPMINVDARLGHMLMVTWVGLFLLLAYVPLAVKSLFKDGWAGVRVMSRDYVELLRVSVLVFKGRVDEDGFVLEDE